MAEAEAVVGLVAVVVGTTALLRLGGMRTRAINAALAAAAAEVYEPLDGVRRYLGNASATNPYPARYTYGFTVVVVDFLFIFLFIDETTPASG